MPLIDERDSEIIEALQRDCRASNAEIARRVHVSEGTIRRRLGRLLDERLIEISVIDRARQDEVDAGEDDETSQRAIINMTVQPQNLNEAFAEVLELPETIEAWIDTGPHDITARVKVKDDDGMRRLGKDKVSKITGLVKFEFQMLLMSGIGKGAKPPK